MTDTPSFASRWADRKRAVQAEAEEVVEVPVVETPIEDDRTDEEILAEFGLKDPDEMVQGDDFTAFLKSEIPKHLKNRALRKLWTSNPVLACVDGLNDYDGDFTDAGNPVTAFKSSYEVGKGYAAKWLREEEEAKAAADSAESVEPEAVAMVENDTELEAEDKVDQMVTDTTEGIIPEDEPGQLEGEPSFPRRKRMRFDFS